MVKGAVAKKGAVKKAPAKAVAVKKPAGGGAAAGGKKKVGFAAGTKAPKLPVGVVAAAAESQKNKKKAAAQKAKAQQVKKQQEVEEDFGSDDDNDDASSVGSSDVSDTEGSEKKIMGVEFRFLPQQFQEPELKKYLSQFGTTVKKCVCLRHKETDSSRGIALVTFGDNKIIPTVLEECGGMLLGGRTVRCRRVFLKRDLPGPKIVRRRYIADLKRRTRGAKMTRFVNQKHQDTVTTNKASAVAAEPAAKGVKTEAIVGALIKYSKREKEHNASLKKMGINYEFNGFQEQYKQVPKEKIVTKRQKRARKAEEEE